MAGADWGNGSPTHSPMGRTHSSGMGKQAGGTPTHHAKTTPSNSHDPFADFGRQDFISSFHSINPNALDVLSSNELESSILIGQSIVTRV